MADTAPNARAQIVEHAGHAAQLQQAEQLAELVAAFRSNLG